jgi:hypothetical protein
MESIGPADQGTNSITRFHKCLTRINDGARSDDCHVDLERLELDIVITTTVKDFCVPVVEEENGGICIDVSNFSGRILVREQNSWKTKTSAPTAIRRTLSDDTKDSDHTATSNPVVVASSSQIVNELNDTLVGSASTSSVHVSGTSEPHPTSGLEGSIGEIQGLDITQEVNNEKDDNSSSSDNEEDEEQEYGSVHHSSQWRQPPPSSHEFLSDVSSSNVLASRQTLLHHLLASQEVTVERIRDIIEQHPAMLRIRDTNGRLPLHILGNNCNFLSTLEGQAVAKQCAMLLMDAFPASVIAEDNQNHMPFVFLIHKWVEWAHMQTEKLSDSQPGLMHTSKLTMQTAFRRIQSATTPLMKVRLPSASQTIPASGNTHAQSKKDWDDAFSKSSRSLPLVFVSEEVEWSFQMLSLGLDYLGGTAFDPTRRGHPLMTFKKERERRDALARNFASIPQVFKTVLLLESIEARTTIMISSIFRRAIFCEASVGPWLTTMIRSNNADSAIDFMRMISMLSIHDYVGTWRKPSPKDEELFKAAKLRVYEQAESLTDLMPSLFVLPPHELDRAVSLPLVWFLMNRRITTPFTVGVTVTDFQLHLTLLIAVRDVSFSVYDTNSVWLGAKMVIFFIAFYQIVRSCSELMVLYNISSRVARRYCINFWNLIDFCGIFGSLLSVILTTRNAEEGFTK